MTDLTIRDALNQTLHRLMAADETVVVIGEDIAGGDGETELGGAFGVTRGLAAAFGRDRVIDTPISETAFVGMATGAAMTGLKPVVEIMFCDFMGVCFDQILNQAAKKSFLSNGRLDLPLVIRTTMGAGDGSGAMHSQSLYGLLATIPGLAIACPATPADAAGLLQSAMKAKGPVVLMEHKGLYDQTGGPVGDSQSISLGQGVIARGGRDITLVAPSAMRYRALDAASALEKEEISLEVIDPRTIKPLDTGLILDSVGRTGRLLVAAEDAAFGGFADAVIATVSRQGFDRLKAAPVAVTPPDTPVPYGRRAEAKWLPGVESIQEAARTMMEGSNDEG